MIGRLPREWKWGPDLLPTVLQWLQELCWLDLPPMVERQPRSRWQVSFMEPAWDFEAYTGRPLPPAPQAKFVGGEMSLQDKGGVLGLIVTLLAERQSRSPSCRQDDASLPVADVHGGGYHNGGGGAPSPHKADGSVAAPHATTGVWRSAMGLEAAFQGG